MLMKKNRTANGIISKFDAFAVGEVNETYERFIFNNRVRRKEKHLKVFTLLSDPWLKRAITVKRASIQSFVIILSLE